MSLIEHPIATVENFESNLNHRFIFSAGRSGSTYLVKLLRAAKVEAISETLIDWNIPTLVARGVISREVGQRLTKLDSTYLYDQDEAIPNLVVKKLPGRASFYPDALMGTNDDAIILYRSLIDIFDSFRRMNSNPELVIKGIEGLIYSHLMLERSGRLKQTITYEQLVSNTFVTLDKAFGDIKQNPWVDFDSDSQAGTPLSRDKLSENVNLKYKIEDYIDRWKVSEARFLARDLQIEELNINPIHLKTLTVPKVIRQSKGNQRPTFYIKPGNLAGRPTNYYHFLIGILFPFVSRFWQQKEQYRFLFPDLGHLNRILFELNDYGWCIDICSHEEFEETLLNRPSEVSVSPGWDHERMFDYASFESTAKVLCLDLALGEIAQRDGSSLLVVLRGNAENVDQFIIPTSGQARRDVPNLTELVSFVEKGKNLEFISLENLSLREQVEAFSRAKVIVAQHGAALANLVWCHPETVVIEIQDAAIRTQAYEKLSNRLKLRYIRFNQDTPVSKIDLGDLASLVNGLLVDGSII